MLWWSFVLQSSVCFTLPPGGQGVHIRRRSTVNNWQAWCTNCSFLYVFKKYNIATCPTKTLFCGVFLGLNGISIQLNGERRFLTWDFWVYKRGHGTNLIWPSGHRLYIIIHNSECNPLPWMVEGGQTIRVCWKGSAWLHSPAGRVWIGTLCWVRPGMLMVACWYNAGW